jgi:subtilisin family serine protease
VVDMGVELAHPDLQANILPGYDASGNNSNGDPVWSSDNHGTPCAGIIGAVKDNGIGISGIAPSCKIIPIHTSNITGGLPSDYATNSIDWAWRNGADVISNSWGGGSPYTPITTAINNAVSNGRSGKGCVVVFSSGNSNTSVNYPANLSNVISVGAMTNVGQRASFSNYGTNLDVVAPSPNIYTTDRQGSLGYNDASGTSGNYYCCFGGTSAACPHVAGVAALILSINPTLIQSEVKNIIESTARKINSSIYAYATTSGRPNGIWNQYMGYGLVDAYESCKKACDVKLYNITIDPSAKIDACTIDVKNVTVPTGKTLELKATGKVTIDTGFKVEAGARFIIW